LSAKNWIKFFFLGLVWGSSFLWIKLALREVGPFTLVFFRVLFATSGLLFYFFALRRKLNLRAWWVYLFIGFFNVALPFVLISWAETNISSGLASILNSTVPLFTMMIASLFFKEDRMTAVRIIGLVVGFTGVLILMANRMVDNTEAHTLGIIAMLVAAACYGASSVFARRVEHYVTYQDHSLGQMAAGLLFITPAMLIAEPPFTLPVISTTWIALAWLGLIGSFVAALIWFNMIYEIGPSRTSMVTYIFPLVGVLLGVIVLNEQLSWHLYVGGLLVLAGIYIVNSKRFSQLVAGKTRTLQSGSTHE
jgi:drug/metabolite transporter (DMT)-like permease